MSQVTLDLLTKICPKTKSTVLLKYVEPLNLVGEHFGLFENPKRMAAFLAQVAHESGSFNFTKEGLNYSASSLHKVFKKYFPTSESAEDYANNAEKIANTVYANRMGNGPAESGDGYKFCGRGLIQLTGRANYTRLAKAINKTIDETVEYLETPEGAVTSAGWFWDVNKLNVYADKEDFTGLTKRINGGIIGLIERQANYEVALDALD